MASEPKHAPGITKDQSASAAAAASQARGRPKSLWRNRNFAAFWIGETVSLLGSQVTFIALPLVAVLSLHASTGQVGLLRFAEYAPFLVFMPLFGVWADRFRRRPLMVASNIGRGMLIGSVPFLAAAGLLRIPALLCIALAMGVCAALFDVCWTSYVPGLVDHSRLIEAMGKVSTSQSAAEVAGPGIGGMLVQLVTAPFALALDALSYLISVGSLLTIRHCEPHLTAGRKARQQIGRDLAEGLRFVFGEPHIRATVFAASLGNFFSLITETVFLVYAVRVLHFSPSLIGLVLTAIGAGGLLGAACANMINRRFPLGRVYVTARLIGSLGALLLPLAAGPTGAVAAMCMTSFFIVQAALANMNVISASLRQALTPDGIRGRMNASARTLVLGSVSLGGLAAGILGTTIGLHATLWAGAIGYSATIIPILGSPIPHLRTLPQGPG